MYAAFLHTLVCSLPFSDSCLPWCSRIILGLSLHSDCECTCLWDVTHTPPQPPSWGIWAQHIKSWLISPWLWGFIFVCFLPHGSVVGLGWFLGLVGFVLLGVEGYFCCLSGLFMFFLVEEELTNNSLEIPIQLWLLVLRNSMSWVSACLPWFQWKAHHWLQQKQG